jgi:membrane protease YdiL (CAAX protease family)
MQPSDVPPTPPSNQRSSFAITDALWIYLLSQGAVLFLVGVFAARQGIYELAPSFIIAILVISPLVLMALVFLFARKRRELEFLASRLRGRELAQLVGWGLAAGVVARLLGGLVLYLEERLELLPVMPNNPFVEQLSGLSSPVAIAVAAFGIVVLAPIAEELFYRAVMLRILRRYLPQQAALVLSAVIFGAVHLNLGLVVPLTLAGYVLGYVYLELESLIPAIVGHALFNAVAVFVALTMT